MSTQFYSGMNSPMAGSSDIVAQRLRDLMEMRGFTQDRLAVRVGATQGAISQILNGKTQNSRFIPKLAETLDVNLGWLLGTSDIFVDLLAPDDQEESDARLARRIVETTNVREAVDAAERPYHAETKEGVRPKPAEMMEIREIDLAYGMGGTFLDAQVVQEVMIEFPARWIRQFTDADASMLVFARGDGDSMSPTINDRDIVLIDQRHRDINRQDRIWAIAYGEIGMIKRIRAMPDGSYKIMSDNAAVEAEIAVDGEMHVIGRVVATIRGL